MRIQRARRSRLGELAQDTFSGARITWFGDCRVQVEGQHGVVELTDMRIRLRTESGILAVIGEELKLRELSLDTAMIEARRIHTVTYG